MVRCFLANLSESSSDPLFGADDIGSVRRSMNTKLRAIATDEEKGEVNEPSQYSLDSNFYKLLPFGRKKPVKKVPVKRMFC